MTTATLLSRVLCLLLMLCYLKKEALFTFKLSAFDRSEVLPLIQKAIPSMIQQSIPAVSTTFLTALVSTYSVTAIAAYGVAGKLGDHPVLSGDGAEHGLGDHHRTAHRRRAVWPSQGLSEVCVGVRLWSACDSSRLSGRVRQTAFRSLRPERGGGHCCAASGTF